MMHVASWADVTLDAYNNAVHQYQHYDTAVHDTASKQSPIMLWWAALDALKASCYWK